MSKSECVIGFQDPTYEPFWLYRSDSTLYLSLQNHHYYLYSESESSHYYCYLDYDSFLIDSHCCLICSIESNKLHSTFYKFNNHLDSNTNSFQNYIFDFDWCWLNP